MKKILWAAIISLVSFYNLAAQVKPTEKQAVQKIIITPSRHCQTVIQTN